MQSENQPVDVLIVGFGAVGILYALKLTLSGRVRITAVARSNFEAMNANGVHIKSDLHGSFKGWKPHRLFRTIEEALDRSYSYVLLTTKALPNIRPNATILAPLLAESYLKIHSLPTFVIMQNGLWVETDLYLAILNLGQIPSIISTAVYINSNLIGDNILEQSMKIDRIVLGVYRHEVNSTLSNNAEESKLLEEFKGLLQETTPTDIVPEIQRQKYAKNLWNACFATSATLIRDSLNSCFVDEEVESKIIPVIREMLRETLAVGRAVGFDESALPEALVEETIQRTISLHKGVANPHRPSMLVDLDNQRPLELDVILGSVIEKGHQFNVAIPRLETVYGLLSVVQSDLVKKLPGNRST
jgi:2-dehydropantoate 2-reductase